MRETRYLISDASKKIDVEAHVLRYWEEELGIDIPRNELSHRYYREEDIALLMSIKRLKEKGFQLKAIRMLLPDVNQIAGLENDRLLDLRDKLDTLLGINRESEEQPEIVYKESKEPESDEQPSSVNGKLESDEQPGSVNGKLESDEQPESYNKKIECGEHRKTVYKKMMSEEQIKSNEDKESREQEESDYKDKESGTYMSAEKNNIYAVTSQGKRDSIKENSKVIDMTSVISVEHSEIVSEGEDDQWESKLTEFRIIMSSIMSDAVKKNNGALVHELNNVVSESIRKEVDYLLHLKEEREEERFKKLDRTIREYQLSRQQTAAATEVEKKKKKSKFFKKNKIRI